MMACPTGHHGWDVEGRVMTRGAHEGGGGGGGLPSQARRPDNMGTPFPVSPPLSAKYRNNYCISNPLFPSFLHHHCLQILYATNFLRENVFYVLYIITLRSCKHVHVYSMHQYPASHVSLVCRPKCTCSIC